VGADYDWHPIRMERYLNSDQAFFEQWEATTFYHSTIGRQVRAGRIQYRHRPEMIEDSERQSTSPSEQKETPESNPETGPVGSVEQQQPIAYSIEFKVSNTTYGDSFHQNMLGALAPVPEESAHSAPNATETPPESDRTLLIGCEMHVVGMYMPKNHSTDDRLYVDVKPTGKPMVLVLTGYFGAQWHLNIDPKADVRQILVPGYNQHEIAEPIPDIPTRFLTYYPAANKKNRNWFWAYAWHTAEGRELRHTLRKLTGLEVTTFQGEYAATRFIIDGVRGRDFVEGKERSSSESKSTDGFWNSLFGSSEADSEPAITPATAQLASSAISVVPDIAATEADRQTAEETYRLSEEASLQAARDYRTEAAQESPDAKALAALKQKLDYAVKRAFEAQMQLQKIRLQQAEQNLAALKSKPAQREALAAKIMERRMADLMNGEDLEWPQAKAAKAAGAQVISNAMSATDAAALPAASPSEANATSDSDLPRYAGRTIKYWMEEFTKSRADIELAAIKALQEYPSSDAYIQNFLHEQWTQIEDEVHEPYVGQRLAEMADVAGPRHRAEVMNYVLKLSERMTHVEDFHDLEMKESWHLKTAVEKLWARGPVSIGEITEILQDGNSMQRLGAIAVLTRILQPFPERVKEGGTNTHEPKTVSWSALASALIAAANDEKPEVRMFAVWLAPAFARLSPDTNDALRNQLKKMIAIDSDPRLREHAALLLQD
jgi:hypothetical protein